MSARTRRGTLALAAAVAVLASAGCAGTSAGPSPGGVSSAAGSSGGASSAAGTSVPAAGPVGLKIAQTRLGSVVVTEQGQPVYRFDKDSAAPPTSTCTADCAARWPPLLTGSAQVTAVGIDGSLVGTVRRSDGGSQVTLAGWPVYRYSGDGTPGQVAGDGVGGSWHAISPTGEPAGGGGGTGGSY